MFCLTNTARCLIIVWSGKYRKVIGFDVNPKRVDELKNHNDLTREVTTNEIKSSKKLTFTNRLLDIAKCNVYIITVPTPIDKRKKPDLKPLISATKSVGEVLKVGDIVKYEAVDDHATHGGPLNGLTEFAEYVVASVTSNSMTLKNTDGSSLTYGNTGGGATGVASHFDSFTLVRRTGNVSLDFESSLQVNFRQQDLLDLHQTW